MKRAHGILLGAAIAVVAIGILVALSNLANDETPGDAISVQTARYTYTPGTDMAINVTLGTRVILEVTSSDVTHGFAIEGYGVNEEIPAGETIRIAFVADRAGDFTIYCTVFCGSGHSQHKGTLHVA